MTIAGRNKAQLAAISIMIIISVLSMIVGIMFFFKDIFSMNFDFENIFQQNLFLTAYNVNSIALGIIAFPILSMILLIFIHNMFKTTHAMEISFFVAFVFAIGFESVRLVFLYPNSFSMVAENIAFLSRLIYFFRIGAVFSLFVSSVFAIKLISRQTSYVMLFIFFMAFLLTVSMPVNNFQVNKFFLFGLDASYPYKFMLIFISFVACVNYFIAYAIKNSKIYLKAAINISILTFGYWFLICTSSYLFMVLGLVFFILGSILFVFRIHEYHLWE